MPMEKSSSEVAVQVPVFKGSTQNLVTCLYETKLAGLCRHVTITWIKNAGGQGLCVTVDDPSCQYTCKVKMNSWSFFWKKQGVKSFDVCGSKVEVFWDLSSAKYLCSPEPQHGYYVAVVCDEEVVLLLGDKTKEAYKRTKARPSVIEASLLSKKEHVFGKKFFCTKAQFDGSGKTHDIVIECQTNVPSKDPYLCIRVDRQEVVHVKNLEWKFRGNQTVFVDGLPVEVFWDVHNWLFNSGVSNAIFIFQTCLTAAAAQKPHGIKETERLAASIKWSGDLNGSISVMKLAGARSLRSAHHLAGLTGASLMLHAWKNE